MAFEALKQRIQAARDRGDGVEVARLRFTLPLSERRGEILTSAHRGGPGTVGLVDAGRGAGVSESARPSIELSEYLLDQLRGEQWDGREEGAWLVGDRELSVTSMRGRTDPDESSRYSCLVSFEQAQELNRSSEEFGEQVVGHQHCQPESIEASDQDKVMWTAAMDALNRDTFVGIILRATDPFDIAGYVMRREAGRVVCRPAEITTWRY